MSVPGFMPQLSGGGGAAAAVVSFESSAVDGNSATIYTFSGVALGAAAADRYIIAGVSGDSAGDTTITTVTIGGVAATELMDGSNSQANMGFFIAAVPTGTTGDVVVTFSGSKARAGCACWRATGLASPTPHATLQDTTLSGAVLSGTINVPSNGFVIAYDACDGTITTTWVGVTEDFDEARDGTNRYHSGGFDLVPGGETGRTVSATYASAPTAQIMQAVSFS